MEEDEQGSGGKALGNKQPVCMYCYGNLCKGVPQELTRFNISQKVEK